MNTIRRSMLSLVAAFTLAGGAAALAATAAPAAPAAPPSPMGHGMGGGPQSITIKDVKAREDAAFKTADANGDGKLSLDEFVNMKRANGERGQDGRGGPPGDGGHGMWGAGYGFRMGMRDGDCSKKDWMPSDAERTKFQDSLFTALDTDHNGQLSHDEFAKARDQIRPVMRKMAFARLDANHDGFLTQDEMPSFATHLEKADTNHDGVVTPDEMRAAHEAARAQCAKQPE